MNENKKSAEHDYFQASQVIADNEIVNVAKIKEALLKRQRPNCSYIDPKDEANETDWDN